MSSSSNQNVANSAVPESIKDDSPSLTPTEALKVEEGIGRIIDILDLIYPLNLGAINEVQNMLTEDPPKDPMVKKWNEIFQAALGIITILLTPYIGPTGEILALLLGGAVDHITNDTQAISISGIDLNDSKGFGMMESRLLNTKDAMRAYLSAIYESPNEFRDKEFSIPCDIYPPTRDKVHTVRDLIYVTVPDEKSTAVSVLLQGQTRAFRSNAAKNEFIKKQYWWVYFVQDANYKGSNFGNAYHPTSICNPGPRRCVAPGHNLRIRKMNNDELGKDVRIFCE